MRITRFNLLATPVRRPLVFATFVFLLMGQLLPSGTDWQMVRILDADGKPQSEFALRADDPRLARIAAFVEQARSAPPRLTAQYVTSKWDVALAEIYARDERFIQPDDSTAEFKQIASNQPAIKQASYTTKTSGTSLAAPSSVESSDQDWTDYWAKMRSAASAKLETIKTNAKESNIFQRTEISETLPGRRATVFFAIQLLLAVFTFVSVSRWLLPVYLPRIPLRTRMCIRIPGEWIGRAGVGMFSVKHWNRYQVAEMLIAVACCAMLS